MYHCCCRRSGIRRIGGVERRKFYHDKRGMELNISAIIGDARAPLKMGVVAEKNVMFSKCACKGVTPL